MTKEEILERSRVENGGRDIEDLEVQKTAAKVAYFSSFGLCALVSVLEWIFTRRAGVRQWIVFFGMLSVAFLVKFSKLKKPHELLVAFGYLVIFISLVIVMILHLTGKIGG